MNIFVLSTDPKEAAEFHCDKHVVKMILETGQMLCAAHWIGWQRVLNPSVVGSRKAKEWLQQHVPADRQPPWKMTHAGHPCTQWAQTSDENYSWLLDLGVALSGVHASVRKEAQVRGRVRVAPVSQATQLCVLRKDAIRDCDA